jgi:TRAP-type C4-dicarboxylate transport system permease small subunit
MLASLHRVALLGASIAVLAMALLGGVDVISATVFGKPLLGIYEATELLMVVTTVLAMSSLQARRMNIAVDLVSRRMPPLGRQCVFLLSTLIGLGLFSLIAWRGCLLAWESIQQLEYTQGAVQIPVYPAKVAFAIGLALLVLQYASDLLHWRREDPPEAQDTDSVV